MPTSTTSPAPRMTVTEVARSLLERKPQVSEPVIELDYKKHPGDQQMRTTWHLEVPAGFDEKELTRIYNAACDLHDALLGRYGNDG